MGIMPNYDPQNVYILQDFPTGPAVEEALKKAEVSVSEAQVDTKLETKQDTLDTAQMAAVNSGITAEKVTEIINTVTEVQTIVIEKIPEGQSLDYATNIDVTIDNTNYQVTFQLKDQNNQNLGTAQTIDLPIESLVMNVEYDSVNDAIVITLQNGTTTSIPVSSLTSGLQPAITNANKLSADLVDDTNTAHKFIDSTQATRIADSVNKVKTENLENVSGLVIETSGSDKVITHSNNVTPAATAEFNKVLYDAHGHVTGATPVIASDVTGLVSGKNLTLADYTKPVSTSAVEPTDTVNQAIGKLEKAVEDAGSGAGKVYRNSSAGWAAQPTLISELNATYVYTDYDSNEGVNIPAIKIGDGVTTVVSLPFASSYGITTAKIAEWDSKVSARINTDTLELY